jgi:hypothetical protein
VAGAAFIVGLVAHSSAKVHQKDRESARAVILTARAEIARTLP